MNNYLELLQLTITPSETALTAIPSERMQNYQYIITPAAYAQMIAGYGSEEESDEAFAEDPKEWLVQLFDCDSFKGFEQKVIDYFGSEQKAVAFLANNNGLQTSSFTETGHRQLGPIDMPETPDDNEETEDALGGLFGETEEKIDQVESNADENTEELSTTEDVLHHLATIEKNSLRLLFLKLFAKNAVGLPPVITGVMYDALLKGLMVANEVAPEETEKFVESVVVLFMKGMEENK